MLFSFRYFGHESVQNCTKDELEQFTKRLRTISEMTWRQLAFAPREGLGYEQIARKDLLIPVAIDKSADVVFSFRTGDAERLIAYRDHDTLHVLWFSHAHDAYHG